MWYTVLITLILDVGGLLLIYALLRDRVRRAASSDAHIAEIRDEVSRLLVELNRTTDRNIALIEDRIASLNELLSSADKKIGLLRRETEKHDVGTQIYTRLAEGRSRVPGTPPPLSRPRRELGEEAHMSREREETPQGAVAAEEETVTDQGAGVAAAAGRASPPLAVELSEAPENRPGGGRLRGTQGRDEGGAGTPVPRQVREQVSAGAAGASAGAAGVSAGAVGASAGTAAGKPPDLQQRVVMLHNAGFAASLIASRVGVPLGEVELIIALQERKGRA